MIRNLKPWQKAAACILLIMLIIKLNAGLSMSFFLLIFIAGFTHLLLALFIPNKIRYWNEKDLPKKEAQRQVIFVYFLISIVSLGLSVLSAEYSAPPDEVVTPATAVQPHNIQIDKPIKYEITNVSNTYEDVQIDVIIESRLWPSDIAKISKEIKKSYYKYGKLAIFYRLPGVATSGIAYASYLILKDQDPQSRLPVDDDGDFFEIKIIGVDQEEADKLLSYGPANTAEINVLGKFIESTGLIVLFKENTAQKDFLGIVEYASDGTQVRMQAVKYKRLKDGGIKMMVGDEGFFYILKDNILSKYDPVRPNKPFYSLKSGV
jgi:hypothetical protein